MQTYKSSEQAVMGRRRFARRLGLFVLVSVLVAVATFTASAATPPDNPPGPDCVYDVDGPGDVPGQKDLTLFCRPPALPGATQFMASWNWDETSLGGNNTGDACGLIDKNANGRADYALCVGWKSNQKWTYTKLYSCDDSSQERCYSSVLQPAASTPACTVSDTLSDPWAVDANYKHDTTATCQINLTGSLAGTRLYDTCSYPSGTPNSDAADCIFKPHSGAALEVGKYLAPNDGSQWAMSLDSTALGTVGDSASTQAVVLTTGAAHTITEAPATSGVSLSHYTTTWTCTGVTTSGFVPSGSGSSITLTAQDLDEVSCWFTNTRNTGSLVLAKSLTGGPNGYTGPFTVHYACTNGASGDQTIAAGSSATVSGIPTGTSCTVSEPALPSVPGYTFGTPTFSPSDTVTIPAGSGSSVTVTTQNTLTRDKGSLVLAKSLTGGPVGYTGLFTIAYDCAGTAYDGSVQVAAGSSQTISGIPTGTSCTISEPVLPSVPGYTSGTPTFSPSDTVTIAPGSVTVTANNTMTVHTYKIVVLVCDETDNTLLQSGFWQGTGTPAPTLGANEIGNLSESGLCSLRAVDTGVPYNTTVAGVNIKIPQ